MYEIEIAHSFIKRLRGLMLRKSIKESYLLFFPNTKRVHSCFMMEEISVVYLDKNFKIIDKEVLKPWRLGKQVANTAHIAELSRYEYGRIDENLLIEILREA